MTQAPPIGPIFRRKLLSSGEENALEHDPEKWVPVSEKIMLKQKDSAPAAPMRPGPGPEFMMES
jgi:hypothetical protein